MKVTVNDVVILELSLAEAEYLRGVLLGRRPREDRFPLYDRISKALEESREIHEDD